LTPSITFTSKPTSTTTPIPLPTDTPISLPSDTPIPLPSDTPIPAYRHIRPILECVRDNGNGTFTAYFGYNNRNSYDVSISIGRDNGFLPFPVDRGQPKNFSPGRHSPVFDVNFIVPITWFLDGDFEIAVPGNDCP
jgi:hypothetical protein